MESSLTPVALQQICVAMSPVIKQSVAEFLAAATKPKPKAKPKEEDMVAEPRVKVDDSKARIAQAEQYAKRREQERETEIQNVASAVAEQAVKDARKNGKNLSHFGEMQRLVTRYRKEPVLYERDKGATAAIRARYYKPNDPREQADERGKTAPGLAQGWISYGEQINAIAMKRYRQKIARGERANLEAEKLQAHDEIFARVAANLSAGSGQRPIRNLIPDDEATEFAHACESLSTRAADIAARRVQQKRSARQSASFQGELRAALDELGRERDKNLWKAVHA